MNKSVSQIDTLTAIYTHGGKEKMDKGRQSDRERRRVFIKYLSRDSYNNDAAATAIAVALAPAARAAAAAHSEAFAM